MKHLRIGKHYRKLVLALINNGFLEEVTPPPVSQKVLITSKKTEDGKAWSLTIPNPGLVLRIENAVMFIDYTNKRTGYEWTRNLTDFIDALNHPFKEEQITNIKEEHAAMKTLVNALVLNHKTLPSVIKSTCAN